MSTVSPPVFGKRNAARPVSSQRLAPAMSASSAPASTLSPDHAAIFAEARRELGESDPKPRQVPRSFRAAFLAALAVGFGLAGLDVTQANDTIRGMAGLVPDPDTVSKLLPAILLFALLGGARAAATNLIIAHAVLRRLGATSHLAYALGGAAVAGGVAALELAAIQAGWIDAAHLPTHGIPVDVAAGAVAGGLYRVFAGASPV